MGKQSASVKQQRLNAAKRSKHLLNAYALGIQELSPHHWRIHLSATDYLDYWPTTGNVKRKGDAKGATMSFAGVVQKVRSLRHDVVPMDDDPLDHNI